jgi:hypothetical protein
MTTQKMMELQLRAYRQLFPDTNVKEVESLIRYMSDDLGPSLNWSASGKITLVFTNRVGCFSWKDSPLIDATLVVDFDPTTIKVTNISSHSITTHRFSSTREFVNFLSFYNHVSSNY